MSKQSPLSLLLKPFVNKNKELYKNDADMLKSFDGLTLDDLQITNIQHGSNGARTASIDSTTKNFSGPDQKWQSCSVHSKKVLELTSATALGDKAEAQAQEPGVYVYGTDADAKYVVVISEGTAEEQQPDIATGVLLNALKFDIPAEQITATDGTIIVEGDTIYGEVEYVVAKAAPTVLQAGDEMDLNS